MRDRLTELLPLLLAGLALVVFQMTRDGTLTLPSLPLERAIATPLPPPVSKEPLATNGAKPLPVFTAAQRVLAACNPAAPSFVGGIGSLKTALGAEMGEPLECEDAVSAQGDTEQKTTTGLAYYRKHLNAPCFTTGWDHWALVDGGIVHWASHAVDPPADAVVLPQ